MATADVVNLKRAEAQYGIGEPLWKIALRRIRRDKLTLFAILILIVMGIASLSAPLLARVSGIDPDHVTNATFLAPLSAGHLLGTDDLGRDFGLRLLYAGQISLSIALTAGVLSLVIGIALGVTAGYYGGLFDDILNWFITTIDSIPTIFLLLLIAAVYRPSPPVLIAILGLLGWTGTMRLVRGETFSLREREFIIAARSVGTRPWQIMLTHIVPNMLSILIVTLALDIGALILTESALSFLGFGVKPPTASWGYMLTDAQTYFTKGAHLVVAPGLLIMVTVLCLYLIGDGLRDAFDPKLTEKG